MCNLVQRDVKKQNNIYIKQNWRNKNAPEKLWEHSKLFFNIMCFDIK